MISLRLLLYGIGGLFCSIVLIQTMTHFSSNNKYLQIEEQIDFSDNDKIETLTSKIKKIYIETKNDLNISSTPYSLSLRQRYLILLIEKYKKFHKKFNDDIKMNHISYEDEIYSEKIVVCEIGGNGIGRTIQSMTSCLLYAILSERVLYFLPSSIPTNEKNYVKNGGSLDYLKNISLNLLIENWSSYFWSDIEVRTPEKVIEIILTNPKQSVKKISDVSVFDDENIQNQNLKEWNSQYNIIYITNRDGDYFGGVLYRNSHHQPLATFPPNYYGLLFNSIFFASVSIWKEVQSFRSNNFGKYTIGIEVRSNSIFDIERYPLIPLQFYLQMAQKLTVTAPVDISEVVWYIVCDDKSAIKKLISSQNTKQKIVYFESKTSKSYYGNIDSLISFYLLAECDHIIGTELSAFGVNAGSLFGKPTTLCTSQRFCYRKAFSSPCQRNPFPLQSLSEKSPSLWKSLKENDKNGFLEIDSEIEVKLNCENEKCFKRIPIGLINTYPGIDRTCAYWAAWSLNEWGWDHKYPGEYSEELGTVIWE